jgi:ABC-type Fe3+-siderophore transport system permease subunit
VRHIATSGETQTRPSIIGYVLGGIALAGLLAMSIMFLATGLMAPLWAIIGFMAVWAILFVLGCLWIRRHPWRVLLLPAIAAVILFGGLRAGTTLLGWTP